VTGDERPPGWVRQVVPEGFVDLHTHFMPDRLLRKVWAYFDQAIEHHGVHWPVHYRLPQDGAVRTATSYREPDVADYVARALDAGARVVKVHVQVGDFDPRDEKLDPAWGLLTDAGVPVVVHCGDGPVPGPHTGLGVFEEVLRRHRGLVAVLAHAGSPTSLIASSWAPTSRTSPTRTWSGWMRSGGGLTTRASESGSCGRCCVRRAAAS
jgi:uncharacterized protein